MSQSAFTDSWYRVASMRPRLRSHVKIHRQRHREEIWYVVQDDQSGRYFRSSTASNLMMCLMDGRRTTQQIFDIASRKFGAERPTQDEVIRLLAQLHQSDLLRGELVPDMEELERRAARQRQRELVARLQGPSRCGCRCSIPSASSKRLRRRSERFSAGSASRRGSCSSRSARFWRRSTGGN
jgi:putative peptide zinc metalloprotease protein